MKSFLSYAMLCITAWSMVGCEKELAADPETPEANSSLTIVTRATSGSITYPVAVFVFNNAEKCVAEDALQDESDALDFQLAEGSYTVYAIAGADDAHYIMPASDAVTAAALVTLKSGQEHTDLMTAKSIVTLTGGGENTLTLGLERQVMELSSVTIKKIPTDIKAVSVSLAPAYNSIQIDGTLADMTSKEIALTNEGSGTWTLSTPLYLLTAPTSSTISVKLTKTDNTSKSYIYNCPADNQLQSNYKFTITGTYTEQQTINLTGSITGATWAGNKTIEFTFDDGNPTGDGGGTPTIDDDVPDINTIYKGAYVLSTTDKGTYTEVLLLHTEKKEGLATSSTTEATLRPLIEAALPEMATSNFTNWRLPSKEEVILIHNNISTIINVFNENHVSDIGNTLFFEENEHIYIISPTSGNIITDRYINTSVLRPVTTIKINK